MTLTEKYFYRDLAKELNEAYGQEIIQPVKMEIPRNITIVGNALLLTEIISNLYTEYLQSGDVRYHFPYGFDRDSEKPFKRPDMNEDEIMAEKEQELLDIINIILDEINEDILVDSEVFLSFLKERIEYFDKVWFGIPTKLIDSFVIGGGCLSDAYMKQQGIQSKFIKEKNDIDVFINDRNLRVWKDDSFHLDMLKYILDIKDEDIIFREIEMNSGRYQDNQVIKRITNIKYKDITIELIAIRHTMKNLISYIMEFDFTFRTFFYNLNKVYSTQQAIKDIRDKKLRIQNFSSPISTRFRAYRFQREFDFELDVESKRILDYGLKYIYSSMNAFDEFIYDTMNNTTIKLMQEYGNAKTNEIKNDVHGFFAKYLRDVLDGKKKRAFGFEFYDVLSIDDDIDNISLPHHSSYNEMLINKESKFENFSSQPRKFGTIISNQHQKLTKTLGLETANKILDDFYKDVNLKNSLDIKTGIKQMYDMNILLIERLKDNYPYKKLVLQDFDMKCHIENQNLFTLREEYTSFFEWSIKYGDAVVLHHILNSIESNNYSIDKINKELDRQLYEELKKPFIMSKNEKEVIVTLLKELRILYAISTDDEIVSHVINYHNAVKYIDKLYDMKNFGNDKLNFIYHLLKKIESDEYINDKFIQYLIYLFTSEIIDEKTYMYLNQKKEMLYKYYSEKVNEDEKQEKNDGNHLTHESHIFSFLKQDDNFEVLAKLTVRLIKRFNHIRVSFSEKEIEFNKKDFLNKNYLIVKLFPLGGLENTNYDIIRNYEFEHYGSNSSMMCKYIFLKNKQNKYLINKTKFGGYVLGVPIIFMDELENILEQFPMFEKLTPESEVELHESTSDSIEKVILKDKKSLNFYLENRKI